MFYEEVDRLRYVWLTSTVARKTVGIALLAISGIGLAVVMMGFGSSGLNTRSGLALNPLPEPSASAVPSVQPAPAPSVAPPEIPSPPGQPPAARVAVLPAVSRPRPQPSPSKPKPTPTPSATPTPTPTPDAARVAVLVASPL